MTRTAFRRSLLALPLVLIACAPRPDLSGRIAPVDTALPWPSLIASPAETDFADAPSTDALAQETEATLARAAALKARAAALEADTSLSGDVPAN